MIGNMDKVLEAYVKGEPIQYKPLCGDDTWTDIAKGLHAFNFTMYEYRIKPKDVRNLWMARDCNGLVYIYGEKPCKRDYGWDSMYVVHIDEESIPEGIDVSWDDEEPVKVWLTSKKPE